MITNSDGVPVDNNWKPCVTLDLESATQKAFNHTFNAFYEKNAGCVPDPNLLTTGWHTITGPIANNLLLGKANRKLSVSTIAYYARLMLAGAWLPTGEPVIIDTEGRMRDAYHRAWACLLSGASFHTFVVTGVQFDEATMLAINNCKPRTDVAGLEFAGLNGLSSVISSVVKMAVRHEAGYYNPHVKVKIHKMSPKEVVDFVKANDTLHDAVHGVMAEFKETLSDYLPNKADVACYVGWRIHDLHGVDIMEDFFTAIGEDVPVGPIALLRKKLEAEVQSLAKGYRSKLDKYEALAFMIKAFNAWHTGSAMRVLSLGTDEEFPDFVTPVAEGAEAGSDLPDGIVTPVVPGQSDPTSPGWTA
jgi:hypothetical protein